MYKEVVMSSIPKIYLEKGSIKDTEIIIDNENYHHLKNVLRLNIGDKITVCDNNKNELYLPRRDDISTIPIQM